MPGFWPARGTIATWPRGLPLPAPAGPPESENREYRRAGQASAASYREAYVNHGAGASVTGVTPVVLRARAAHMIIVDRSGLAYPFVSLDCDIAAWHAHRYSVLRTQPLRASTNRFPEI